MTWASAPMLYEIETEVSFSLQDLMQALGCLELKALGYVKHRDAPRETV
jgi:hypothetical protein